MNSAGSTSQNQCANNAPKLVLRKNQGSVQRDNTDVPSAPPGNGDKNKAIHKVTAVKPLTLNQEFRKMISGDEPE